MGQMSLAYTHYSSKNLCKSKFCREESSQKDNIIRARIVVATLGAPFDKYTKNEKF